MNFDDQTKLNLRQPAESFPVPKVGQRICEHCVPPVAMVLDMSKPRYECRCPRCGGFDRWFGPLMKS